MLFEGVTLGINATDVRALHAVVEQVFVLSCIECGYPQFSLKFRKGRHDHICPRQAQFVRFESSRYRRNNAVRRFC